MSPIYFLSLGVPFGLFKLILDLLVIVITGDYVEGNEGLPSAEPAGTSSTFSRPSIKNGPPS